MNTLFATSPSNKTALILRVVTGGVILMHGLQKVGMIGGGSTDQTIGFLMSLGIPGFVAWLVIAAETLGAASLILGFLTRFCAASIALVMLGAIWLVHLPNGFFMPGGYEFHLLALGSLVSLVLAGGGMWSVDSMIMKKGR